MVSKAARRPGVSAASTQASRDSVSSYEIKAPALEQLTSPYSVATGVITPDIHRLEKLQLVAVQSTSGGK